MTVIYLGRRLLAASSDLPESLTEAGRLAENRSLRCSLFGLAPGGVYLADRVASTAGALLPHRFTLTTHALGHDAHRAVRRFAFCCTGPSLTAGRRYRPPCPAEPGLSSRRPAVRRPLEPQATVPPTHTVFKIESVKKFEPAQNPSPREFESYQLAGCLLNLTLHVGR